MALKDQIDRSKNQGRRPSDRNTSPRPESLRDSVRPAPLRPGGAITPSIPRDDTDDLLSDIDDQTSPATTPSAITPKQDDKNHDVYDRPGNEPKSDAKKSLEPSELGQKESEPDDDQATQADNEEDDRVNNTKQGNKAGQGKKHEPQIKISGWRRRSVATSLLVGTIFGGGLGGFFISKGPLELLHLGGILDGLSGRTERSARSRLNRFATEHPLRCKIGSCNEIGETRVTWAGSRRFHNIEGQLRQNGIEFERRTSLDSRPTAMNIDSALNSEFRNPASVEAKRSAIAAFFEVDVERVEIVSRLEGRFRINMNDLGIGALRALTFSSIGTLQKGIIPTAMGRRAFARFLGLPSLFSPFKRTAAAAEKSLASRSARKTAEQERRSAQAELVDSSLPLETRSQVESVRSHLSPSVVQNINRALLATDLLCAVHTVARAIPAVNYVSIVIPSVVAAIDKLAVRGAIQAGEASLGQVGSVVESFIDDDGQTIWAAKSLNSLIYSGFGSGIDIANDLRQAFTNFTTGNALVDWLGDNGISNTLCSAPGQILLTIADIGLTIVTFGSWSAAKVAAAGGSTAASIAAFTFLQNHAIDAFSRDPIRSFGGAQGGNLMAFGARYGANLNAIAMGGVALSLTETFTYEKEMREQKLQEFQQKSFFARMFDVREPRSLASSAIRSSNDSPKRLIANTASGLTNSTKLLSNFFSVFTSKVAAQADEVYDWDFPLYGVPQHVLDDDTYANPYENAETVAELLDGDQGPGIIQKARDCFGVRIMRLRMAGGAQRWSVVPDEEINPTDDSYTEQDCGNLTDPNWARVMVFVFDTSLITQIDCYEGDQDACNTMIYGVPEETDTGPPVDPSGQPTGPVTDESQLINVQGTVVHNSIAEPFGRMLDAALDDGVDIRGGGGWRSPDGQIERRRANCGTSHYAIYEMPAGDCSPPTARPGTSMHERGLAIDFPNCSTRGTACWQWLNTHAANFGFHNLESEPWHWSTSGG